LDATYDVGDRPPVYWAATIMSNARSTS